jgi:toxin HigB-1
MTRSSVWPAETRSALAVGLALAGIPEARGAAVLFPHSPEGFPGESRQGSSPKLTMVDAAAFLEALNSPPGNRLEALKGDLTGKHSSRINDQWRIVFRWTDAGPEDVEIIDYH